MKSAHTIISLAILFLSLSLPAMNWDEIPLTPFYQTKKEITTNLSLEDLVATIDTAIKKKHGTNNIISDTFAPFFLSETTLFDIIDTINQCYPTLAPNDELINTLYDKNNYFKKAIDYFCDIASKNLQNVTCSTLSLIEQPELPQPTRQLNQFLLPIKTYILNKALNQIEHSYEIKCAGHTDMIRCFDISPTAHLAATGGSDKTTRIWDLKTGIQTRILQNLKSDIVHFNPDGSRLATIEDHYSRHKKFIVKEWNPHSGDQHWSIESQEGIQNIAYAQNTPNNILAIFSHNIFCHHYNNNNFEKKYTQTLILLNENNPCPIGTIPLTNGNPEHYDLNWSKSAGNYYAEPPTRQIRDNTTLYITKKNCRELYLCEQAIQNTPTWNERGLLKIAESLSYTMLTDYEKQMVQTQIKEKIAALTTIKRSNTVTHTIL